MHKASRTSNITGGVNISAIICGVIEVSAMAKKIPYYSNDRKLFPMTKTEYVKRGSRWFPVAREQEMISRKQAGYVLDKRGLPFERSHRLEKRDRYRHNEPYDTFSSISPDGQKKV